MHKSNSEIKEWAGQFVRMGATMAAVEKEIAALNLVGEVISPADAAKLKNEFTKQTLANMEISRRARQQYAGWKHSV
jgi:hypothetical protein